MPLRFKNPEDYPHIAKFTDEVNFDTAKPPLRMYFKEEELREDEETETRKDGAYYRRRKGQRRIYRRRSTLVLEDESMNTLVNSVNGGSAGASSASAASGGLSLVSRAALQDATGFRFEGRSCNLSLAEIEDQKKQDINAVGNVYTGPNGSSIITNISASSNSKEKKRAMQGQGMGAYDAPFKYVLLQFIKTPAASNGSGGGGNEINVIPVGNMYAMKRRNGLLADELLGEMDERFIEEKQKVKQYLSRYKHIKKALDQASRNQAERNGETYNPDREFRGGFDSAGLFGSTAMKKKMRGEGEGGSSGGGGGGSGAIEEMLTDSGVDLEALKESQWNEGDYSSRFVDDEENNVEEEQQVLNDTAEYEISSSMRDDRNTRLLSNDGDDVDSDYDDDGSDVEEDDAIEDWRNSKVISQDMIDNANEAIVTMKKIKGEEAAAAAEAGVASQEQEPQQQRLQPVDLSEVPQKSAMKRERADSMSSTAGDHKHRVTFKGLGDDNDDGAGGGENAASSSGRAGRVKPRLAGDSHAAVAEYTLTEKGVRQFIINKGGMINPRDLDVRFK